MKKSFAIVNLLISLFVLTVTIAHAQVMWQVSNVDVVKWHYLDGDEFKSPILDSAKWQTTYPWGRSLYCNKEQQYYTHQGNHEIRNGFLKLTVKKESITGKVLSWEADDHMLKCSDKDVGKNKSTYNYTSGMIYSVKKYQYGYYEMKFRSDKGAGLWPAFWLYAGHENDEIDIFEIKGERNSEIHVDMHCPSGCNNYKTTLGALRKNWGDYISTTAGWHEGFNVVGLEWTPTYIKWYLNGKGIAYWKGNMEAPSAVIANLAIPSNDGPFGPGPDATTKFPASFEIDYIRIWSLNRPVQSESFLEPVLSGSERAALPYGSARMTSKPKPEYKKSALKKETLNVTFSKIENSGFLVSFTGRPNDDFSLEVKDANQNVVYKSSDPKVREHHFYITETGGSALLLINVNGQKIEHRF